MRILSGGLVAAATIGLILGGTRAAESACSPTASTPVVSGPDAQGKYILYFSANYAGCSSHYTDPWFKATLIHPNGFREGIYTWMDFWGPVNSTYPNFASSIPGYYMCKRPGVYTIEAVAGSDSGGVGPPATALLALGMGAHSVTLDFDGVDLTGRGPYTGELVFDGIPKSRVVWAMFENSVLLGSWHQPAVESPAQIEGEIAVTCKKEGVYSYFLKMQLCADPQRRDESNVVTAVSEHTPTVSLTRSRAPNAGQRPLPKLDITYDFPQTSHPNQRKLVIRWTPSGSGARTIYADSLSGTLTGVDPPNRGSARDRVIEVLAIACPGPNQEIARATLTCECCETGDPATCVGGPINVSSGTMRYADTDPLPGNWFSPLVRTYESTNAYPGSVGGSWHSMFDAWASRNVDTVEGSWVTLQTEAATQYAFQNLEGIWTQVAPSSRKAKSFLAFDSTARFLTHREPGSSVERVYDMAQHGRLVTLRDRTTGRETRIEYTYDGSGIYRPTRVSDSWGAWAWRIESLWSSKAVTKIELEGDPSIAWSYEYSGERLVRVRRPGGVTWRSYTYDASFADRLSAIRDGLGNLIEGHSYDQFGFATTSLGQQDDISSIAFRQPGTHPDETITRVTTAAGQQTDYHIRELAGTFRTVAVDGPCTSCGVSDAVYAFDSAGRLVREQDASGYVTMRSFEPATGNLTSETTALKPYGCDPRIDADHCRLTSEELGTALLEMTGASEVTEFRYQDPSWPDRVTTRSAASGWNPSGRRGEHTAYDGATGMVVEQRSFGWTDLPPRFEERVWTTSLYQSGETAAFDPGGDFSAAWLTLPQPVGQTRLKDGPRQDVADVDEWVYYPVDPMVPATWRGQLAGHRNAAGHVSRYADYDAWGNARRIVDPNGVATERTFDGLGRQLSSTLRGVSGCDLDLDPICDADLTTSNQFALGIGPVERQVAPGGAASVYSYDERGRVLTISRGPSALDLRERVRNEYDPLTGKRRLESLEERVGSTWLARKQTAWTYDAAGRLKTTAYPPFGPTGDSDEFDYDRQGRVISHRDSGFAAANTRYGYDPAGRLEFVEQLASSSPERWIRTEYVYDAPGHLIRVIDANGGLTEYGVDDFGQTLRTISEVTGTSRSEFDLAGNLIWKVDARGIVEERGYDALGRLLSREFSDGTESAVFGYDDSGNGPFEKGRRTSACTPNLDFHFTHDRRGLEVRKLQTVDNPVITSSVFDEDGDMTTLVYPSGREITYAYDFAGRPISVAGTGPGELVPLPYISGVAYEPFGPERSANLLGGVTETRNWDQRYRMTGQSVVAPGAVMSLSRGYTHTARGFRESMTDLVDASRSRTMTYDLLGRLRTVASPTAALTEEFTYDDIGNRLTSSIGPAGSLGFSSFVYQINATGGNLATLRETTHIEKGSPVTSAIESDESGNVVADEWNAYEFDGVGRLRTVTSPGSSSTVSFLYDADGNKAVESHDTPIIAQRSDLAAPTPPIAGVFFTARVSAGASGRMERVVTRSPRTPNGCAYGEEIVWFNGRPLAVHHPQSDRCGAQDILELLFSDPLDYPLLSLRFDRELNQIDESWRGEARAFGELAESAGSFEPENRYPGQWEHSFKVNEDAPPLFANGHRDYRPGWGRYLQADPVGLRGGINLYSYAANDPLLYIDPRGLSCSKTCPECPTGRWYYKGVQGSFMLGFLGASASVVEFSCPSGPIACTFLVVCGRAGGGVSLAFTGQGGGAFNAYCSDDLSGFSIGADADLGLGYGGSSSGSYSPGSGAVVVGGEAGFSAGAASGSTGCIANKLTCRR